MTADEASAKMLANALDATYAALKRPTESAAQDAHDRQCDDNLSSIKHSVAAPIVYQPSETPRCDAAKSAELWTQSLGWSFARQLERELCEKDAVIERLEAALREINAKVGQFSIYEKNDAMPMLSLLGEVARIAREALRP